MSPYLVVSITRKNFGIISTIRLILCQQISQLSIGGRVGASISEREMRKGIKNTALERCSSSMTILPTRDILVLFLKGFSMARGRKTSFTIHLTPAQRQTLLAWQRATAIPAGLARRGRIILLLANGMTITDIAATVGMSRPHAYKWIRRFMQDGVEGLIDKPQRHGWNNPRRPDLADQDDADIIS